MLINKYNFYTDGLNLPENCPVCGGDLEVQENGQVKCINPMCTQKTAHKIEKCIDKLGVKGAGPAFYEKASKDCKSGLFGFLAMVVANSESDFNKWAGGINGVKVLNKLQKALEKPISVEKYISLLDIEGVGEGQIEKITKAFPNLTLDDFINPKSPADFICEGIKDALAEKIFQGLKDNKDELENCKDFFKIADSKSQITTSVEKSQKLTGLSFCFTGKAEAIGSRKLCESLVLENGGAVSVVKKGLSYLVTDDTDSGSSKNKKAKELGIPVITSFEFKQMIEN